MTRTHSAVARNGIANLFRFARQIWWLPGILILLAGAAAFAQVTTKATSQFCYNNLCGNTLDEAEQKMRSAPENADIGALLEQKDPVLLGTPTNQTASYLYAVKDQPASPLYAAAYMASGEGNLPNTSGQGCTPATGTPWTDWCADEGNLVSKVMAYYATAFPNCTFSAPTLIDDTRIAPYKSVSGGNSGGTVDYGDHLYQTDFSCQTGSSGIRKFRVYKKAPSAARTATRRSATRRPMTATAT